MNAITADAPVVQRVLPRSGAAIAGWAVRSIRRGALVLVVAVAGMTGVVAATYAEVIAGAPGGVDSLRALVQNPAIRTLFGEPLALDTAGGFTVWRTGAAIAVILGMWSILSATRLFRGEEDTGRWALLVAGTLSTTAVTARVLAVIAAVPVLAGVGVTAVLVVAGTPSLGAVLHGTGLALTGLAFAGVGALSAQLFSRRAAAVGAATAVLPAGLLVRMVGDGVLGLGRLRWLSPFGLTAETAPFYADRLAPLLVLAAVTAVVLAVACTVAGHRDIGEGLLPERAGRSRAHLCLLRSPKGFAARTVMAPWVGWSLGVGAFFLLIGLLTVSLTGFLTDNAAFADLATRAGFGLDTAAGYAATMFALLALPAGGFAVARISVLAADESSRRLALLLAAPLTRTRFLVANIAVAVAATVLLTGVAGLAFALGAGVVDTPLGPGQVLAGAFNTLPVALLGLGAAVLALGWAPRFIGFIGAVPTVGGFLWLVIAQSVGAPRWIENVSPFAHLAAVPAEPVDWAAGALMLLGSVALGGVGLAAWRRRDLRTA